eukprot:5644030-Amphidinium_carterae.1
MQQQRLADNCTGAPAARNRDAGSVHSMERWWLLVPCIKHVGSFLNNSKSPPAWRSCTHAQLLTPARVPSPDDYVRLDY